MSLPPVRPASVSLLTNILDHGQTLDEALGQNAMYDRLTGSDRGLARAIVSSALRHLGQIDRMLGQFIKGRELKELDREVQHLLRVGAAQICILKTPTHAAVSETVDAARAFEATRRAGGLVNAVLRKLGPDSLNEMELSAITAWPIWFQKLITHALGDEAANLIAQQMQITPPLDLTMKADVDAWAEKLSGEVIGPSTVRLGSGLVEALPGYDEGEWWVQDVAASLPVHLLAPKQGESILDLCAAPGGKTLQIASSGARTTALDRSAKRLKRVEANLERTKLSAQCQAADATKWESPVMYDGVLVDAPCSALGTLRRHPEGPWIKRPDDLARYPDIQARILQSAAKRVKRGGRMVYCVCTPLPREGVEIVEAFLTANPEWSRAKPDTASLGAFADALTPDGDLLTMPPLLSEAGGCDIFYIARLEKA